MEWTNLLSTQRLGRPKQSDGEQGDPRTDFTRDWDRIVFSSAFRRLQDKTQVFPLAKSDYVRTRFSSAAECPQKRDGHWCGCRWFCFFTVWVH